MTLKLKTKLSSTLTRRWRNARPGSVLILVVALLVLLALIGTAYLSSTQGERYTSSQNTLNTEADLLLKGVVDTVNAQIAGALFGGGSYRAPSGDMPTYYTATTPTAAVQTGYNHYTSALTDTYLADRLPAVPTTTNYPTWNSVSWPLFLDSSSGNTFDSPFDSSTMTYVAANRSKIVAIPTYKYYNGGLLVPGLLLFVPSTSTTNPTVLQWNNGPITIPAPNGAYIAPGQAVGETSPCIYKVNADSLPGGLLVPTPAILLSTAANIAKYAQLITFAGSASGDGIADAGFVKVPVGQIDGITYYSAIRVVDANSAINASSAWTQGQDTAFGGNSPNNYGFFRTNTGLQELLITPSPTANLPTPATEIAALNTYRFGGGLVTPTATTPGSSPTLSATPVPDAATATASPTNFSWYSYGDAIERQMTARAGNPGYNQIGAPASNQQFQWLGVTQSASLAYKYLLTNPNVAASPLEQLLPNELTYSHTTPYSPTQVLTNPGWWYDNFNELFPAGNSFQFNGTNYGAPLRAILTGNNAVSNATPGRLGNGTSNTPVPAWALNTKYNFGDWVTDMGTGQKPRSYVCIQQHTSTATTEPGNGVNARAVGFWAGVMPSAPVANGPQPGVPWTQLPIKTSVNTATFEQLWLGFAQVMTDSVGLDSTTLGPTPTGTPANPIAAQWQPPMQPSAVPATPLAANEQQMGQFRSVVRTATNAVATRLTTSQMLKLRAAIAAVNTMDLRDSDDDVTSRHIVLTDTTGKPQYDVEVYGIEKQPYISEVVVQVDGTQADTYVAVELSNPYPKQIKLTNWQISSIDRSTTPLQMTAGVKIPDLTIPAAVGGIPGIVILEDSDAHRPRDIATTISANLAAHATTDNQTVQQVTGLAAAVDPAGATPAGATQLSELYLMRPRRADGTQSKSSAFDTFDETQPTVSVSDYVPVDQLDMSGLLTTPIAAATRYYYRRATDGTAHLAWNMIYPGCYEPSSAATGAARYFTDITKTAPAIVADTTATSPCSLGAPKKDKNGTGGLGAAVSTYATLPIELNNQYMAGPNSVAASNNVFPYGAFARNVDMLQITFIGAYRVRPTGTAALSNNVTELNSVTIDSALAYDNSTVNPVPALASPSTSNGATTVPTNFTEQIGRFCPIGDASNSAAAQSLDFGPGYTAANKLPIYWHYHWAKRLFDYFTVQAPADDYFPNYDPSQGDSTTSPVVAAKYTGGIPQPIDNTHSSGAYPNATVAGFSEDTTGVEGLININTAPVPVLAQLPFVTPNPSAIPPVTAAMAITQNATLAQAIVNDRNTNGPFLSIFDLYRVPKFRTQNDTSLNTTAAGPAQGIFSPGGIGTAAVTPAGTTRFDFQERFLLLNNISNLITTRSDTFTCYVLLQGWRGVGTGNPTKVIERRAAFLLDRNVVTPTNKTPFNFPVPTD